MAKDPYHLEEDTNMARGGFPGIPGGNMQQLMRQAQKMQQQMIQLQEELDAREYEASSGGGMVHVKVNGKRELLELTIKPVSSLATSSTSSTSTASAVSKSTLCGALRAPVRGLGRGAAGMGGLF